MSLTEQEIDRRWPVLAQVVRAIEWHGDPDVEYFCKSFEIELSDSGHQLDRAEAELAALPGKSIVEVIETEAGDTHDAAPTACIVLSRYFS
jgi:hypothetical protein